MRINEEKERRMNRKKNKREEESESFVTNRVGCGKTKWLERKKDARQSLIITRNQRKKEKEERKKKKRGEKKVLSNPSERISSLLNCHRREEKNVPLLHPNLFFLSFFLSFFQTLLEPIVSHSWLVTHPNVNDSSSND